MQIFVTQVLGLSPYRQVTESSFPTLADLQALAPPEIIWVVSEATGTWITPPRDFVSCSAVRHGLIVNLLGSLRAVD